MKPYVETFPARRCCYVEIFSVKRPSRNDSGTHNRANNICEPDHETPTSGCNLSMWKDFLNLDVTGMRRSTAGAAKLEKGVGQRYVEVFPVQ